MYNVIKRVKMGVVIFIVVCIGRLLALCMLWRVFLFSLLRSDSKPPRLSLTDLLLEGITPGQEIA